MPKYRVGAQARVNLQMDVEADNTEAALDLAFERMEEVAESLGVLSEKRVSIDPLPLDGDTMIIEVMTDGSHHPIS